MEALIDSGKFVLTAGNITSRGDTVAGLGDSSHPSTGKFVLPAGNSMARGDTIAGQGGVATHRLVSLSL